MALGYVTVAEVGELKTEIAFHGDVLNTAARIQGLCNKFDNQLLHSATLAKEFAETRQLDIRSLGEVELRGKEGLVEIFSCRQNS